MRISKFFIKLIWLIGLVLFMILAFILEFENMYFVSSIMLFLKIISIGCLFMWTLGLADDLKEMVNLKYKTITDDEQKYWIEFEVKYLTFRWLFILYWKTMETKYHTYKSQNIFGAEIGGGYSTDVTYESEDKAIEAINEHKAEFRENRREWFERPKRKKEKVNYI